MGLDWLGTAHPADRDFISVRTSLAARLEHVSKRTIGLFRARAIQRMAILTGMTKVPMARRARVAFTGLRPH
jgi:hypothetical protein